jgi:hypothetical protein
VSIPIESSTWAGWIRFEHALPRSVVDRESTSGWAAVNAGLSCGDVRLAQTVGRDDLRLIADVRAGTTEGDDAGLQSASQTITRQIATVASALVRGEVPQQPLREPADASAIDEAAAIAGWPCAVDAGRVRFHLESRAGSYAATAHRVGVAGHRLVVELADLDDYGPSALDAAATLLLVTSGIVRLATAGIETFDGRQVATLSAFVPDPIEGRLDDALMALATGCQLCGRETRALADERLAQRYLALWSTHEHRHARITSPQATEEEACLQQL